MAVIQWLDNGLNGRKGGLNRPESLSNSSSEQRDNPRHDLAGKERDEPSNRSDNGRAERKCSRDLPSSCGIAGDDWLHCRYRFRQWLHVSFDLLDPVTDGFELFAVLAVLLRGAESEVVTWRAPTEADEADVVAKTILQLGQRGYRYRDIAVLVRSSTSYARLLEALGTNKVPVQPAGRTGLFKEPDAQTFGRTFAYLAGNEWRTEQYGSFGNPVRKDELIAEYVQRFQLDLGRRHRVHRRLDDWKAEVDHPTGPANLVGNYYDLLGDCGAVEFR